LSKKQPQSPKSGLFTKEKEKNELAKGISYRERIESLLLRRYKSRGGERNVLWLDRVVVTLLCKEQCSGVLERRILSSTSSFLPISAINNTITVSIPPLPSFFLSLYYLFVAVWIKTTLTLLTKMRTKLRRKKLRLHSIFSTKIGTKRAIKPAY